MVVTPNNVPLDPSAPLSPLLLASRDSSSNVNSVPGSAPGRSPSMPPIMRKLSTGSFSKLSEFWLDGPPSGPGTPQTEQPGSGVDGIAKIDVSVDASEWRHPVFKTKVLSILRRLNVPQWNHKSLKPSSIHLQKVSGALTNAVFFVSFNPAPTPTSPSMSPMLTPTMPPADAEHPTPLTKDQFPPTLLFRVYGPSSDNLIARDEELRILHVLSTTYGLGPTVFGTFGNGRVEQFFPSRALKPDELRVSTIARSIARRMRELHSVDLRMIGYEEGTKGQPMIWNLLSDWLEKAEETITSLQTLGGRWEVYAETFSLHKLRDQVETYRKWVMENPDKGKGIVFSHNDTQYGNLLLLDAELPRGVPEHHKYIVIDFEYASPNYRGYDIANHFHEWRANYHHESLSYSLKPHFPYPTRQQRDDWYRAYLSVQMSAGEEVVGRRADVDAALVEQLEKEMRIWSPAPSVMWSLWGLIQAEEQITNIANKTPNYEPEFDYLAYSLERLEMFRDEAREIGVPL